MSRHPHIVMIVSRGEAVRNFLYSDTLSELSGKARVTLLSVVHDEAFIARFGPLTDRIIPLEHELERRPVLYLRTLTEMAHFRWLWSEVAKNLWEWRDAQATSAAAHVKRLAMKGMARLLAHKSTLQLLSAIEREASWQLRPSNYFQKLFKELKPDLVFNCSHIHGPAAELPVKVAHRLRIPTAGFIFSWDNLTSRSRIFAPYDYYLVWNRQMRDQLLHIYRTLHPGQIAITGTPQFDFHFKPEFHLTRSELCDRIGISSDRPFVLYTTGIDNHFPEEHRTVELVARLLLEIDMVPKPQLVVRTYVKGTSPEMKALAARELPGVVFPQVQWDEKWFTPQYEDLAVYTSLLSLTSLGINAASTVSLELMMHDKPVINLGFDPPGSNLPHHMRFAKHLGFNHYRPVVQSGAVMVARSVGDMSHMLRRGLSQPTIDPKNRHRFIRQMFDDTLDGASGKRVAEQLLGLARGSCLTHSHSVEVL